MVHSGFSAEGQLITLVYRGKINDLTLSVKVKVDLSVIDAEGHVKVKVDNKRKLLRNFFVCLFVNINV